MRLIYLNLSRAVGGRAILAVCSLYGVKEGFRTDMRSFPNEQRLTEALEEAGVPEHQWHDPLLTVRSGMPSFIKLSDAAALHLRVLVEGEFRSTFDAT